VLLTAAIFLRHTLRPAVMDRGARATI
jgi:hypothetical protein